MYERTSAFPAGGLRACCHVLGKTEPQAIANQLHIQSPLACSAGANHDAYCLQGEQCVVFSSVVVADLLSSSPILDTCVWQYWTSSPNKKANALKLICKEITGTVSDRAN